MSDPQPTAQKIESFSQFARRLGVRPSYVTKLRHDGRLVLTAGNRVDVEASLARIEDTKDPNRDDVRKRHERARLHPDNGEGRAPPAGGEEEGRDGKPPSYVDARARKEHFLGLTAKLEYERASGKLVETAAVQRAGAEAGAALRSTLENLPDQLAATLAPVTDEAQLHALLVEALEAALTDVAARLEAIGKRLMDGHG
jgi:hypothetical protein